MTIALVYLPEFGRWADYEKLDAALSAGDAEAARLGLAIPGPRADGGAPVKPGPPPSALLDAAGMERETGVAASWFESAANRGAIPSTRFGRWVRFDLREVLASGIPDGARRVIGGDNHREQLELTLAKQRKGKKS